jgi:hypothetical protein
MFGPRYGHEVKPNGTLATLKSTHLDYQNLRYQLFSTVQHGVAPNTGPLITDTAMIASGFVERIRCLP